jgi:DNA-binding transcriptional regulator LsrR (DeoR family)
VGRLLDRARRVSLVSINLNTEYLDAFELSGGLRNTFGLAEALVVVDLPIHDRRIGIELADLRRIPKVVGVAGGEHKAKAILGALHGGFLDVLVTNELAAIRLLELERSRSR